MSRFCGVTAPALEIAWAALLAGCTWLNLVFWAPRAWAMHQGQRRTRKLRDVDPATGATLSRPPGASGSGGPGSGRAGPSTGCSSTGCSPPLPRLGVIVPALDEEAGIRAALESLAGQDYPDLLIIPVDDRSTDRTGALMEEVAAGEPRVKPIHVSDLPPRWLGKNHANQIGAETALEWGAEWLLFTDGDVQFSSAALRKAVAYATGRRLDHLSVSPELQLGGFWETAFLAAFVVGFMGHFQPWHVEDPASDRFIGIGAFNLVRAEAYRAIGGHETLALTVADDMALGKLIKRAGFRQGYLEGTGEVRVRWQTGLGPAVRGLYKNSFASLDFSVARTAASAAFLLILNVLVFALPGMTAGWTRLAASAALGLVLWIYFTAARALGCRLGRAAAIALCAWFGGALFAWTFVASAAVTLRQGGVVWRGTLYPAGLLRDGQIRL